MGIEYKNLDTTMQGLIDAVDNAKTEKEKFLSAKALEAVAGSLNVMNVTSEGAIQTSNVTQKGNEQIKLVTSKGDEKIDEINDLKSNSFKTIKGKNIIGSGDIPISEENGVDTIKMFKSNTSKLNILTKL